MEDVQTAFEDAKVRPPVGDAKPNGHHPMETKDSKDADKHRFTDFGAMREAVVAQNRKRMMTYYGGAMVVGLGMLALAAPKLLSMARGSSHKTPTKTRSSRKH